jgi:hypothetical protein
MPTAPLTFSAGKYENSLVDNLFSENQDIRTPTKKIRVFENENDAD